MVSNPMRRNGERLTLRSPAPLPQGSARRSPFHAYLPQLGYPDKVNGCFGTRSFLTVADLQVRILHIKTVYCIFEDSFWGSMISCSFSCGQATG